MHSFRIMPKYRYVIEFESKENIPKAALDRVLDDCAVQLESFDDGSLEELFEEGKIKKDSYQWECTKTKCENLPNTEDENKTK